MAVWTGLGGAFAQGLIVVHDGANELTSGGTSQDASFKVVILADILTAELRTDVSHAWDG